MNTQHYTIRTLNIVAMVILLVFLPMAVSCSEDSNPADSDGQTTTLTTTGYVVVETGQVNCYDNQQMIASPSTGESFCGQDAQYSGNQPSYANKGDSTITDNITGLIWTKSPDLNGDGNIDASDKKTYTQAVAGASSCTLDGYDDWRLPTIKELYSLILFSGVDPSGYEGTSTDGLVPFIDTDYFDFAYGDTDANERIIDAQFATSSMYVDGELLFGVNFADGRIKGYGLTMPFGPGEKTFFVLYVRGNTTYGINSFVDNGDSTVTDNITEMMWMQYDSQTGMTWESALSFAENLDFAGHTDWRLPNVKELQSIVDYTRSPGTSGSAAIDPLFNCTQITNEAGQADYGFYWSSTTHANWSVVAGGFASYVCFGRALGYMDGAWQDVHGAGAQRSDPKSGDPGDYPTGHGPQGDAIRIYNYVRCVRDAGGPESSCGDTNGDEEVNVADAVFTINYVFKGGSVPESLCLADANGDDGVNLGDSVYLINYVFRSGQAPIEPCCP